MEIGEKFDMLTIKEFVDYKIYGGRKYKQYLCLCDCGNYVNILETTLKNKKHFHSCGCYQKKYLTSGDSKRCSKAGKHRKNAFVNGSNIQMTFRNGVIKSNSSGVQGVSWSKTAHKWHVYVGYQNYRCNLGFYDDINLAINIRQKAEQAIKDNTFEDFFYELRGFRIEEKLNKLFKKKIELKEK